MRARPLALATGWRAGTVDDQGGFQLLDRYVNGCARPPLLGLMAGGTIDGAEQPHLIQLIVHKVLAQAGDSRAYHPLASAHDALQTVAARITDLTLRQSYLNIPEQREIEVAWAAQQMTVAGLN